MGKRKHIKFHEEGMQDSQEEQEHPGGSEPSCTEQTAEGNSSSSESSSDEDEFPNGAESSPDDSSEDDEDGAAFTSVDVDFEFFDPAEKDYHGLKTLLTGLLDGEEWACSELVDTIITQSLEAGVGTVIKCGEDDDPIGISTVLNLQQHKGLQSLSQLHTFLERHVSTAAMQQHLSDAWAAHATGLVLNERLVNCPPQLAQPLQEALFDEVAAATDDSDLNKQQREAFNFQQYLMVFRAYIDPMQQGQQSVNGNQKQQKKKQRNVLEAAAEAQASVAGLVHVLPEAECYQAAADWCFSFPTPGRMVAKDDLQQCRVVMLVKAAAIPGVLRQLKQLLQTDD